MYDDLYPDSLMVPTKNFNDSGVKGSGWFPAFKMFSTVFRLDIFAAREELA
jgi:hypothetical protein